MPRFFLRWHHTAQRPPGRELERKVPGDAVASAALAGVVVFITQIYSEPRRLAPSPDTVGGRDGSYKPRFGSINFHGLMGGQNCLRVPGTEPALHLFIS